MSQNSLFEKLRQGKVALGLSNSYPAPGIVEAMCRGWDFVWIDGQHGEHSYESILHTLRAAAAMQIDTLIRVPGHEWSVLGTYADLAPQAIMVPMVSSAKQAQEVVQGLYFPPLGTRSYGGRRATDLYSREYYTQLDILVVVQIETVEAVENARAIAGVSGVHALFFGPDDMKVQMGLPIGSHIAENEKLKEGMKCVALAAREAGKLSGCVAGDRKGFEMAVSMGYQLIACGGDVLFLRNGSRERLEELRAALG